jgi:hypothetical protein
MLAAVAAVAKGPCMIGKPRVVESGNAMLPAAERLEKGDNLKMDPLRICEGELVLPLIGKPVLLMRDPIQTPGTKPVPFPAAR